MESMRLQDVLIQATQAFQAGQYARAIDLFNALEETFGREPELREPSVQRILLPARGYSEFAVRNYEVAIDYFESFLAQFPERGSIHAFVLYSLGQAELYRDNLAEAAERFGEFVAAYPGSPETSLAALQQADLLFRLGKTEEAVSITEALYGSGASETLRTQARLRTLQERVEAGQFAEAAEILLATPWRVHRMPELAALAFAALKTGDALMQEESFEKALRTYRLVPPFDRLLRQQRTQLQRAHEVLTYRQRNISSPMATAWISYYTALVARLEGQLEVLQSIEDYTPGYLLRYGQAFLSSGRGREALILFRELAGDETVSPEIRQQAHYRWILADFFLQNWENTLAVALEFEELYPDSELAPDALYLVAQAHQEQMKYRQAIEVYNQLLDLFPDHRLAPRWLFTRGFNLAMLERYEESRADFTAFTEQYPDHPLVTQARLWHGLTHHFNGDYEEALAELIPLAEAAQNHYLYPEIRYRVTTARYARQDYETALAEIDAFLEEFPMHQRVPEAMVLRGDVLMGLGKLIPASTAFAQVTPEAGGLFPYAVFQRGKIFKALERYDLMVDHFTDYLDRDDLDPRPRMSEALYWLGWAYLQEGQPAEALLRFDQAVDEFGNDPSATEIQALLSSFEALRSELLREEETELPDHPVLLAPSFSAWMDDQIALALAENRLTWFSRLKQFQATRERVRGNEEMAATLLQEIDEKVPMESLDPQVIGQVGLIYSERGYGYATDYFDYILANYPNHPARAEAWFGKAQILFEEGELEEADDLLRKFDQQIPLHPLAPQVKILRGRILTQLGYYEDAENSFEDILQLKEARGIPHAQALAGLAEMNEVRGNPQRAIPYWQRIYTLYRAYPERVAEAYYRSAVLFAELDDYGAAYRSLNEMLADKQLQSTLYAGRAENLRTELLEAHGPFSPEPTPGDTPTAVKPPQATTPPDGEESS